MELGREGDGCLSEWEKWGMGDGRWEMGRSEKKKSPVGRIGWKLLLSQDFFRDLEQPGPSHGHGHGHGNRRHREASSNSRKRE
jgi:hypothetical protein